MATSLGWVRWSLVWLSVLGVAAGCPAPEDEKAATCGASGQACCTTGSACTTGLTCTNAVCQTPAACGGSGQLCCTTGSACTTGLTCTNSTCQASAVCGGSGEACCASGTVCTAGLTCQSGTCQTAAPCGASGQACCKSYTPCSTGLYCYTPMAGGTSSCAPKCGTVGQPCCGATCNAGLSCVSNTCQLTTTCGGLRQACCGTAPACVAGLTCSGGHVPTCEPSPDGCGDEPYACCVNGTSYYCFEGLVCKPAGPVCDFPCGTPGKECCASGTVCPTGYACVSGTCQATPTCGTSGKPCCTTGNACNAGLTCNGSGQCVAACTPSCSGKACGDNGCGGTCGTCAAGQTCTAAGQCTGSTAPSLTVRTVGLYQQRTGAEAGSCASGNKTSGMLYALCPGGRILGGGSYGNLTRIQCGTYVVQPRSLQNCTNVLGCFNRVNATVKDTLGAGGIVDVRNGYNFVMIFDETSAVPYLSLPDECSNGSQGWAYIVRKPADVTSDWCDSSYCPGSSSGYGTCGTDCDCGHCWYCESGTCRYGGEGSSGCYRGCPW